MRTIGYIALLVALLLGVSAYGLRVLPLPDGISTYQEKLYFSGTPTLETMDAMRSLGVTRMIDLRGDDEDRGATPGQARRLGIEYFSVPVSKAGPLPTERMRSVESLTKANQAQKTWVFCSSGNRAAAWLAIHLATAGERSVDEAIEAAKGVGLKNEQTIAKVREYLGRK